MYAELNAKSWNAILAENRFEWAPPRTVHLPIQPVHSPDLVHVDGSLNVCRRRLIPGLSVRDPHWQAKAAALEAMLVQILPGDAPFVPQGRACRFSLAEGRLPVVAADYFADILYRFDFFCEPGPRGRDRLWIRARATNTRAEPHTATFRLRAVFAPENGLFDYHYIPFYWDNTKYPAATRSGLDGRRILRDGRPVGVVQPGRFACDWEARATFSDADYARLMRTYFPEPAHRFRAMTDSIRLCAELAPGESAEWSCALLTDFERAEEADVAALETASPETARETSLAHFQSFVPKTETTTRLVFPTGGWDKLFDALQVSSLQLLVRMEGQPGLVPTQGGSSERHFVWVWEACFLVLGLLHAGRYREARGALDFIFALQDGGCPPEGRLVGTAGAIGTTGPRWLCTTGAALALASAFHLRSRDDGFLEVFLPRLIRAADWIIGELRATRRPAPDGSRPPTYGLMPFGVSTDGDIGNVVSFTDAYTFWGLDQAARLLARLGHPRAEDVAAERDRYREDIRRAVEALSRPDGFIDRKIVTGTPGETYAAVFEILCGASHLGFGGAVDPASPVFRQYVSYFETHLADGYFAGKMNPEIYYMGVGEWVWQHIYLSAGEWKKAFMAAQANLKYGMSQDTFQVQERFSISNPDFVPWQPNGSGNGRMLDMLVRSLYFESGEEDAVLLGGVPFLWLRMNGRTALRYLHTSHGLLSLEAVMDGGRCRLRLEAGEGAVLPRRIRIPAHFAAEAEAGAAGSGEWFSVPAGVAAVAFRLRDAEADGI